MHQRPQLPPCWQDRKQGPDLLAGVRLDRVLVVVAMLVREPPQPVTPGRHSSGPCTKTSWLGRPSKVQKLDPHHHRVPPAERGVRSSRRWGVALNDLRSCIEQTAHPQTESA